MPISSHISLIMLLSKLAPQALRCLASAQKIEKGLPQKLGNSFSSLIGGHICHNVFYKMVTKDHKVHHVWGVIQLHCGLNAGKVNMQQLQRSSDNGGLHWGFGTNAFMLDASLTDANCLLHLSSHAGLPELVMQQAQCLLLAFVPSIMVTSIHGSYPVSLGDHKLLNFSQFANGGVVMVKGSLGRALASSDLRE